MIYIVENVLTILLATFAGLAIGLVWLRVSGILLPGKRTIVFAAIAEFWLAAILAGALILSPPQAGPWVMALGSAFVIWIGFVLPAISVSYVVAGKNTQAAISASVHWLAVMLAQAAIMQAIGLTAPA